MARVVSDLEAPLVHRMWVFVHVCGVYGSGQTTRLRLSLAVGLRKEGALEVQPRRA